MAAISSARGVRIRSGAAYPWQQMETGTDQPMKVLIVVEHVATGYSAFSPDLPGCVATGATRDEVEATMRDAITFHVEGLRLEGLDVPEPTTYATVVDVAA